MFVLLTLVALLFRFWVLPAREQQEIVGRLRNHGVKIAYDVNEPKPKPIMSLDNWLPIDYVQNPQRADFSDYAESYRVNQYFTAREPEPELISDLDDCTKLCSLKKLYLAGHGLNDDCLARVAEMKTLEWLHADIPRATPKGIGHLTQLRKLKELILETQPLAVESVEQLAALTELEQLHVATNCDGMTFIKLPYLPKLRRMEIRGHLHIEPDFESIGQLQALEELYLDNVTLAGQRLRPLMALPALRSLQIQSSDLTDDDMQAIARMPVLETLVLSWASHELTGAGLKGIGGFRALRSAEVQWVGLTDDGLAGMIGGRKLQRLILVNTKVTNHGLDHLAGLTSLEHLIIKGPAITDEGLVRLQQKLPRCAINLP